MPLLPALGITATPVAAGAHAALKRTHAGVRYEGALGMIRPEELSSPLGPPAPLRVERSHRGVCLTATLDVPPGADALALHLSPVPGDAASPVHGLVVVFGVSPGIRTLRITLRMMDAWVDVSDSRGLRRASGRADLGGLRPPPEGYERERPLPLPWRPRLRLR